MTIKQELQAKGLTDEQIYSLSPKEIKSVVFALRKMKRGTHKQKLMGYFILQGLLWDKFRIRLMLDECFSGYDNKYDFSSRAIAEAR